MDARRGLARLLAVAPDALTVEPAGAGGPGSAARSYSDDGRVVRWTPAEHPAGLRFAVDAERSARPVPAALARRHRVGDADEFWPLWTAVEVACKLRDVPVPVWLRRQGLRPDPAVVARTFRAGDLVVTCGALPAASVGSGPGG